MSKYKPEDKVIIIRLGLKKLEDLQKKLGL